MENVQKYRRRPRPRANCWYGSSTGSASDTPHVSVDLGDLDGPSSDFSPESSQDTSVDTDVLSETVSKRKLKLSPAETGIDDEAKYNKEKQRIGYRLIDIECLNAALKGAHMCKGGGIVLEEDFTQRQGLCSTFYIRCTKCGHKKPMQTSKRNVGQGQSYDINRRAAFTMSELGLGREGMAEFCCLFDMPPPSHSSSWSLHNKTIRNVSNDVLQKEYIDAGKRLRQSYMKDDDTITDDSVLDVMVSCDGTWQHRGFKSTHGVAIVMSVDTGEVLDAAIMSKDCVECTRMRKKDPVSDEYMIWEYNHVEGGFCTANYEGPSSGMEQEAVQKMWNRSIELHKMRYKFMLCDGDSKALNDLNDIHKPYGEEVIEKIDCVNHVHKRMGKGLRTLRKTSSIVKGGANGLKDTLLNALAGYYRGAIMRNTTTSRDPQVIEEMVKKMKTDIMAGLYHTVKHEDAEVQHQFCSVEWCSYLKDKRDGTNTYKNMHNKLPFPYLHELKPLYDRLSTPNLLSRCVPGLAQNQNEAFNRTLWRRCPVPRQFSRLWRQLFFSGMSVQLEGNGLWKGLGVDSWP